MTAPREWSFIPAWVPEQQAFLRYEGPRYDPELALAGYRATIDLFRRRLG